MSVPSVLVRMSARGHKLTPLNSGTTHLPFWLKDGLGGDGDPNGPVYLVLGIYWVKYQTMGIPKF